MPLELPATPLATQFAQLALGPAALPADLYAAESTFLAFISAWTGTRRRLYFHSTDTTLHTPIFSLLIGDNSLVKWWWTAWSRAFSTVLSTLQHPEGPNGPAVSVVDAGGAEFPCWAPRHLPNGICSKASLVHTIRNAHTRQERIVEDTLVRYIPIRVDDGVTDKRVLITQPLGSMLATGRPSSQASQMRTTLRAVFAGEPLTVFDGFKEGERLATEYHVCVASAELDRIAACRMYDEIPVVLSQCGAAPNYRMSRGNGLAELCRRTVDMLLRTSDKMELDETAKDRLHTFPLSRSYATRHAYHLVLHAAHIYALLDGAEVVDAQHVGRAVGLIGNAEAVRATVKLREQVEEFASWWDRMVRWVEEREQFTLDDLFGDLGLPDKLERAKADGMVGKTIMATGKFRRIRPRGGKRVYVRAYNTTPDEQQDEEGSDEYIQ